MAGDPLVCFPDGVVCLAWCSAWPAGYFLLLRQKKVTKEKATPVSRPAARGPLRYSKRAGAEQLAPAAPGLRQCSPFFRPLRRCSALHKGRVNRLAIQTGTGESESACFAALWDTEQRRSGREKGRVLSEGRRPELRSPPARPSAPSGSPFLWLLSFGEARESMPAGQAETGLRPGLYAWKVATC